MVATGGIRAVVVYTRILLAVTGATARSTASTCSDLPKHGIVFSTLKPRYRQCYLEELVLFDCGRHRFSLLLDREGQHHISVNGSDTCRLPSSQAIASTLRSKA
jgi:hypothetical protein